MRASKFGRPLKKMRQKCLLITGLKGYRKIILEDSGNEYWKLSGLSKVKLKQWTLFVEILYLQWTKLPTYLFSESGQRFLHARYLRKYESEFFHRMWSILWTFEHTICASCKSKAKARISCARYQEIIMSAIWERPLQKWRQNSAHNYKQRFTQIWLKGYRKRKEGNEKAACLSPCSVEKASLFGSKIRWFWQWRAIH